MINIVTGDRESLSQVLAEHHDVNAGWYFGSAAGSKSIELASSSNMKLKRTWVNYGHARHWSLSSTCCSSTGYPHGKSIEFSGMTIMFWIASDLRLAETVISISW
ncbi:hypothetical protein KDI_29560 [Dictyobacter arantiisoli]|uniref:Aldehyde dehydrogenase domain-containing protein n=1 Tax=Dictyobacter arantiisoli TaxID=2014874 RepID=A0A5A5TD58_9CHLR|nr:hypothetical protein KDI_29560 [Dictyobacter arantiisoli]